MSSTAQRDRDETGPWVSGESQPGVEEAPSFGAQLRRDRLAAGLTQEVLGAQPRELDRNPPLGPVSVPEHAGS
jgi:hypothetical protein